MSYPPHALYYEDLALDQEWRSPGRTITVADIVNFAGLSGDFNPIHVDHEFARTTPFHKPIAHGLLVYSVGSGLGLHSPTVRTMALMEVRQWVFKGPVFIDDTIHVLTRAVHVEPRSRGRRAVITWHRQILNQDNKVVQEGQSLTMVLGRLGDPALIVNAPPPVPDKEIGSIEG